MERDGVTVWFFALAGDGVATSLAFSEGLVLFWFHGSFYWEFWDWIDSRVVVSDLWDF